MQAADLREEGRRGGLFNESDPHCCELRATNLHLGFKTWVDPSGAGVTVGSIGGHGAAQAGPSHSSSLLLGPGVWGHAMPLAPCGPIWEASCPESRFEVRSQRLEGLG